MCDACVDHSHRPLPATEVREHLLKLRKEGVGIHAVRDASDVSNSLISRILAGQRTVQPKTAARLLGIDEGARADGAMAPWTEVLRARQLLARLKKHGFRQREINQLLGLKGDALQFGRSKRLTVRRVASIDRLWKRVERGEVKPEPPPFVPSGPVFEMVDELVEEEWLSRDDVRARLGFDPFRDRGATIRRERAEKVAALDAELKREREVATEQEEREWDRLRFGLARVAA